MLIIDTYIFGHSFGFEKECIIILQKYFINLVFKKVHF